MNSAARLALACVRIARVPRSAPPLELALVLVPGVEILALLAVVVVVVGVVVVVSAVLVMSVDGRAIADDDVEGDSAGGEGVFLLDVG